jgi:isoleucyl-tRNA synthetase
MLRWMAPFLSFTAEEAWTTFGKSESIFLETFTNLGTPDDALLAKWNRINEIRAAVNKEIETVRTAGSVGASLQAEVSLWLGKGNYELLSSLGNDLKFVFIVSKMTLAQYKVSDNKQQGNFIGNFSELTTDVDNHPSIQCLVNASEAKKCERCWHYSDDVGHNPAHPTLCGRCDSNLHGDGEVRHFA